MSNGTFMEARESSSGFSMLELVVALAMAAVLVAYAVPSYLAGHGRCRVSSRYSAPPPRRPSYCMLFR